MFPNICVNVLILFVVTLPQIYEKFAAQFWDIPSSQIHAI